MMGYLSRFGSVEGIDGSIEQLTFLRFDWDVVQLEKYSRCLGGKFVEISTGAYILQKQGEFLSRHDSSAECQ